MNNSFHLDIGCGSKPRNPFNCTTTYGVDIIAQKPVNFHYINCNVTLEPLPFEDDFFDSVSAFDFLEHVPRTAIDNGQTTFPFIRLMNEIHRVLKPGGIFYAITPGYPREEAFADPTHVNFITKKTHSYFTSPRYNARMYGFTGEFDKKQVKWVKFSQALSNSHWLIKFLKNLLYTVLYTKKSHILWEFEKPK